MVNVFVSEAVLEVVPNVFKGSVHLLPLKAEIQISSLYPPTRKKMKCLSKHYITHIVNELQNSTHPFQWKAQTHSTRH